MATEKEADLIEAMISSRVSRRVQSAVASAVRESVALDRDLSESTGVEHSAAAPSESESRPAPPKSPKVAEIEGRLDVRPIGTPQGFKELHILHKRTWDMLNVHQKRVTMILWPLAFHFGLYQVKPGQEKKRPPLVAAFWARCLADAPLTLGHLYPPQIFKGVYSEDVWEFGGMVVDPTFQGKGLMRALSDTAKLFLFSRRPKLIITNPVEPLYELYKQLGLKTVGKAPVKYPYVDNANVWLMYGDFDELAKPYFM
ncbi:MAG: GNAT family N-acetyltransferase [Candidatus Binataceae bacterium]